VSLPAIQILFRIPVLNSTWNDPVTDSRQHELRRVEGCQQPLSGLHGIPRRSG